MLNVKNQLIDNLNDLGDQLRISDSDFSQQGMVRAIIESQESSSDMSLDEFDRVSFKLNVGSKYKSELAPQECITPYQGAIISDIDQAINSSDTPAEYGFLLEELIDKVLRDDISESEKTPVLLLIASQQASVEFIDSNQDLFRRYEVGVKSGSWWSGWGKCAASILGGAVTGATTLGLAGAAVGTVVLPIIGTVGGGVVGVIGYYRWWINWCCCRLWGWWRDIIAY